MSRWIPSELGTSLANRMTRPDIAVELGGTAAVANLQTLQEGHADITLTAADVAYLSFVGELDPRFEPFGDLRGIAVLQLIPLAAFVSSDSGVTHLSQLRGRRVSIPPDSSTALMAEAALHAFGIDATMLRLHSLGSADAINQLAKGMLDAVFLSAPLDTMIDDAIDSGARVLPLTGAPIERLLREQLFFRPAVIRHEAFIGGAVATFGTNSLLVCRRDLDGEIVYNFTKALFELLLTLSSDHPTLRFMDGDSAPATPVPLHEGAARYYRERELFR
jgi:TRAP transporter TAXI family solute receptor